MEAPWGAAETRHATPEQTETSLDKRGEESLVRAHSRRTHITLDGLTVHHGMAHHVTTQHNITQHTSHNTQHTSHITHHTSHIAPHTSHITQCCTRRVWRALDLWWSSEVCACIMRRRGARAGCFEPVQEMRSLAHTRRPPAYISSVQRALPTAEGTGGKRGRRILATRTLHDPHIAGW